MKHIFSTLPDRSRAVKRTAYLAIGIAALLTITRAPGLWSQGIASSSPHHNLSLDVRDAQGRTPLIDAAAAGQTGTVRTLLERGAGIDATAADGRTALIFAVQGGQMETVQALIAGGADLNKASRSTGTALNVAENTGKTEIAALLLASGARSTGKSVGDTVCIRPWGGDGFCGTVQSFSIRSVSIQVNKILGCANGCSAREECSASKPVGGADGLQAGNEIAVPSWCLTQTGVKP
jgi:hypothetical protein